MLIRCIFLSLLLCGVSAISAAPTPGLVDAKPQQMRKYESPYYDIYTDVDPEQARGVVVRMTKMAEEYHDRTKDLFSGTINQKLPFYLFSNPEGYYANGGPQGTIGVFMPGIARRGSKLMAMTSTSRGGDISSDTWHTIQHEGFHQFVQFVVRGDIPTWVNEGMAEYFGEGIFTGDMMITGAIRPARCRRLKAEIKTGYFKSLEAMMQTSHFQWNMEMSGLNYDQAWSMCHFLSHGENGKYQNAFASFMQGIGRGQDWETSWVNNFGSADGFEAKWRAYWENISETSTDDLHTKAVVATLTSFLGRAYTQKQKFDSFDDFIKNDVKSLKSNDADWLPPDLYNHAVLMAKRMQQNGYTIAIGSRGAGQPTIICVAPSGQKFVGTFKTSGLRMAQSHAVSVEMAKTKTSAGE
jgi:hypothetical protein